MGKITITSTKPINYQIPIARGSSRIFSVSPDKPLVTEQKVLDLFLENKIFKNDYNKWIESGVLTKTDAESAPIPCNMMPEPPEETVEEPKKRTRRSTKK